MATYVNDLRLKEIATGDEAGTWGTSTNTNLELIAEAFSYGTEAITTNADTHTTTIADGSTDPGRSIFLKYTGTLDSTCTITIGPNTVSKLWFIENATSGSQSIIISQGSGASITIANGQTKAIYSDGAGSGAAMIDAFQDLSIPDLFVSGDLDVDGTANLDVVDVDGATNFGADVTFAAGAALITATAGTDNVRIGEGAGDTIASGAENNVTIGKNAGTAITTGDRNSAIGTSALLAEDAHGKNIAIGHSALSSLDAGGDGLNVAVGDIAGQNMSTGTENVLVGAGAGVQLTTGARNVGIGRQALYLDTAGNRNVAVGYGSLENQDLTTSTNSYNTAVGYVAGNDITEGIENVLIGALAGDKLTHADSNTALGYNSLSTDVRGSLSTAIGNDRLKSQNFTTAINSHNTAVGYIAGGAITTGVSNPFLGSASGDALTDADFNVAIGHAALTTDTLGSRAVAVGYGALQDQNFTTANNNYNIGIGYNAGNSISTGVQNTIVGGIAGDALTDAD